MGSIFRTLLIVAVTSFVAIGLACLIVGAVGNSWWKYITIDTDIGLWSITSGKNVFYRTNILKFHADLEDPRAVEKDIILILIIIGGGFALFSICSVLFLLCCFQNRAYWLCGSAVLIVTTFMAGGCSLAAIIFAEINFKLYWKQSEYGYSAIFTWVGSGSCVIAFIFSFFTFCVTPSNEYFTHAYNQSSLTYVREKELQMDNIGYDASGMPDS
ncbi:uncharacterized protein LOC100207476 isoform X1 [Hydra vulgaris]|uniref:uncharacterized protein LOC100207476 isoform X1 n=1 Tax=Hydra vulgaris TaxID=6087 RepID=UPI0002B435D1|nr:uncharacterized protein LOC100207476 [Hydra vulgaris]